MKRLVLVLGDQLTPDIAALRQADKARDVVVMAEVGDETRYVAHHPKKIAFVLAAMRKFADRLRDDGWSVDYTRLDGDDPQDSINAALLAAADRHGTSGVIATEPGEWRLIAGLRDLPLDLTMVEDDRFIASHRDFEDWAEGRKSLRMEYFYREMRRRTGLLMKGDKPEGGEWNYDAKNRKPPPDRVDFGGPMQFTPDDTVREVLDLVGREFADNFGSLDDFWFATDAGQARRALSHFIRHALADFGPYQDAMLEEDRYLYHSVLSIYINAGLLDAREVCDAVAKAHAAGDIPLNSAEGFIRQIVGWREYMRGIYFLEGPDYTRRNALNHQRKLPDFFWDAETDMNCIAHVVAQTRDTAYAHHIQRLMITGNFALLAGIDPGEVHEWYLSVYADAYEWVEAPNVIGMSQFADGGTVASKPYVSSGNYIDRMSDYCAGCAYSVKTKIGQGACPFNLLYWAFLDRHRDRFAGNRRMANMYATWDRMDADRRETVLKEAKSWLKRLDSGARV